MAGESDIIGMIGQGTTGIIEAISGSMMYYDAMKGVKELDRPEYEIPTEIQQIVDLYAREYEGAYKPLAWESGARSRQQEITASGVAVSREAATSASDVQAAAASLYSQERRALADLEIEAARQKEQRRTIASQQYGSALETSAQYRDKAWTWNEAMKFQEEYNKLMGLAETGYEQWQMGAETISASFDSGSQMDFESLGS